MVFILLLLVVVLFAWGSSLTQQLKVLNERLKPIADAEAYAKTTRKLADSDLSKAKEEANAILGGISTRKQELERTLEQLNAQSRQAEAKLMMVNEGLKLRSDEAFLLEVGYYEPVYGFEDLSRYEKELRRIKDNQKQLLRISGEAGDRSAAAFATSPLTYNGSEAQGRQLLKRILRLMLRAFNGECDSFIARVNYRNIEAMKKRITSSYDQINQLAETWHCSISEAYLKNRISELELVYEYEEAKQKEREEQARIREQMREEEKAAKEAEKARQQADKEEQQYQALLERAQGEAAVASETEKERLNAKVHELQKRIAEIEEKKRAISQAMLTKFGHVYIISNLGSFGENVYKIGMTRRLEPMDRVKELGDASVPFPFDVHALIRTSDAPRLENALHKHFNHRRLNLENDRKEFFHVSIEEIRDELETLKEQLGLESELRLTLLAEAKEYRMSQAKRKHLERSWEQ
jgi:hypothetical protein